MEQPLFESTTAQEEGRTQSPPYISWLTFLNLLDWLEHEGVPHQFDRSFWSRKFSGSAGTQLLNALRFLGLLVGISPQATLERIVSAKGDERKALINGLLKAAYTTVEFDKLERATPQMLSSWFKDYPIDGATKRKAESFLINALKFVDHPLSPSLMKKARNRPAQTANGSSSAARGAKGKSGSAKQGQDGSLPDSKSRPSVETRQPSANIRQVELKSGGAVALSVSVDLFALSEADRTWVLRLVDEFRKYDESTIAGECD